MKDLIEQHQAGIWRYLRFLGCDRHQADDLTQETFLAVLRRPFEDRSPGETAVYLRRVARGLVLTMLRKNGRGPRTCRLEQAESVWAQVASDDGLEDYLAALRQCLDTAVNGRAREALQMRYAEGVGRQQMAQRLSMSEDGVKTLLRRARSALYDCVERKLKR